MEAFFLFWLVLSVSWVLELRRRCRIYKGMADLWYARWRKASEGRRCPI